MKQRLIYLLLTTLPLATYAQIEPSVEPAVIESSDVAIDDPLALEPSVEPEPELTAEEFIEFDGVVSTENPDLETERNLERSNKMHTSKMLNEKYQVRKDLKDAKAEQLSLRLEKLEMRDEVLSQRKADV